MLCCIIGPLKWYILTLFDAGILRVLCHDSLYVCWFAVSLNMDNRRISHLILERKEKTDIFGYKIAACTYAFMHTDDTLTDHIFILCKVFSLSYTFRIYVTLKKEMTWSEHV